jgi:nucleoside phosphorylase
MFFLKMQDLLYVGVIDTATRGDILRESMLTFLFATKREAAPLLERCDARIVCQTPYKIMQITLPASRVTAHLIAGGIGRRNITRALAYVHTHYPVSHLVNAGICGSLADRLNVGDMVTIRRVAHEGEANHFELSWAHDNTVLRNVDLLTVDDPVFCRERRAILAAQGDVVDMEGYAIAEFCEAHGISCEMVKGVSDAADEKAQRIMRSTLDTVSLTVADQLLTFYDVS